AGLFDKPQARSKARSISFGIDHVRNVHELLALCDARERTPGIGNNRIVRKLCLSICCAAICHYRETVSVEPEHLSQSRLAESNCLFEHCIEHRREVAG